MVAPLVCTGADTKAFEQLIDHVFLLNSLTEISINPNPLGGQTTFTHHIIPLENEIPQAPQQSSPCPNAYSPP
jgi:hypothetical protein